MTYRECTTCGYVSLNDEIGKDEPPRYCPECGRRTVEVDDD